MTDAMSVPRMTYTEQHIAEAKRRLASVGWEVSRIQTILAEALASPAWEPPVDPDKALADALRETWPKPPHGPDHWSTIAHQAADRIEQLAGILGRAAERAGGE